jgi:hypothetical protein
MRFGTESFAALVGDGARRIHRFPRGSIASRQRPDVMRLIGV